MSKSAELDGSRINLLDDAKLIQQKVKRAKTDTFEGLEYGNPDRPEATNLLGIYSLCTGVSMVSPTVGFNCNTKLPYNLDDAVQLGCLLQAWPSSHPSYLLDLIQ